jgi:photosystem II stability/assembly factor-like uncharacterized protein
MKEDKKREFYSYLFVIGIFLFVALFYSGVERKTFTGFAVYQQEDSSGFDEGDYYGTEYSSGAVRLIAGEVSGTYTSKVLDGGHAFTLWNSLAKEDSMPSVNSLYGVDGAGDVYRSTDSGMTWVQTVDNYGRTSSTSKMFSNSEYIFILSSTGNEVWRSSTGNSFELIYSGFDGKSPSIGKVGTEENLFVVTGPGEVWKSSDSGETWNLQGDFNPGIQDPKGLAIDSNGYLYAVDGAGDVYSSSDEGVNWVLVNDGYGGSTATDGMVIDSNDNLYILLNYEVYLSEDLGVSWNVINDSFTPYGNVPVEIAIDASDDLYVVDAVGRVFVSEDSGASWEERGDLNNAATNNPKGMIEFSSPTSLEYEVRACSVFDCSDGSWEIPVDLGNLGLEERYFQFRVSFSSPTIGETPEVSSVSVEYTPPETNSPSISFGERTASEGTFSNQNSINVEVNLSDESQIYSFINFNNSLIGFWKMDENLGTIEDFSGYERDATNSGAIYGADGVFGSALEFDGINDKVSTPLDLSGIQQFTLSAWYYRDSNLDRLDISQCENDNKNRVKLIWHGSGLVYGVIQSGVENAFATFPDSSSGWKHFVMVYDGSQSVNENRLKIYSDGEQKSLDFTGIIPAVVPSISNTLALGYDLGAGVYGKGRLDEVLVFNRVLSSEEVVALYDASSYSQNFTSLDYGEYGFYAYAKDVYGNEAQTSSRIVELIDNSAPSLVLANPFDGGAYGYNESLSLRYSVSDEDNNLDSCWYVLNSGSPVVLPNCVNTTIDVPEGENLLVLYANDSEGEEVSDSSAFNVQVGSPSISLSFPDGEYLNYEDVNFFYIAEDLDLEFCELWGDFYGDFEFIETDNDVTSGVERNFSLTLEEGNYVWNVRCNDSLGNSAFNGNKTFAIDITNPEVSLSQPSGVESSRSVEADWIVEDESPVSCIYNVYRGDSLEISNRSLNCSSNGIPFEVTVDASFTFNLYVSDLAGNFVVASSNFSVDTTSTEGDSGNSGGNSGGGGGGSVGFSLNSNLKLGGISNIISGAGENKRISLSVENSGIKFLQDCFISGEGDYSSWISSSEIKGLAGGEKHEFDFDLFIPEEVSSGTYLVGVNVSCLSVSKNASFEVELLEKKIAFELGTVERVTEGEMKVDYSLKELSGIEQNVELEFLILDSEGNRVAEKTENVFLNPGEEKTSETVISIGEVSGNLDLLVNINSETYSSFVQEDLVIGAPVSGFAVFGGEEKGERMWMGVIVLSFLVFAFFMVKKILRSKLKFKQKSLNKS